MTNDPEFVNFIQSINQRVLAESEELISAYENLFAVNAAFLEQSEHVLNKKHLVSLAVGELAKQIYELKRENVRLREQVATYQRTLKKEGSDAPVSPAGM